MKIQILLFTVILCVVSATSAIDRTTKDKYMRLRAEAESDSTSFATLELSEYQFLADPPSLPLSIAISKAEAFISDKNIDISGRYLFSVGINYVGPTLEPEWRITWLKPGSIPGDYLTIMVPMESSPYKWE